MRQPEGFIAFDPDAGRLFRKDEVTLRGDRPARLAMISAGGAYDPVEIAPSVPSASGAATRAPIGSRSRPTR
jgi:hypothetical protein